MVFSRRCAKLNLFIIFVCALLGSPSVHAFDQYRLGPQDKLRIRIGEWRANQAELYEWKNLSGESTVNSSGNLSLPLLGEVPAANLSVSELMANISELLQKRIGLSQRPDTSVEVIQFRPFYIVGDVQRPGEYPFRPGMNVLQAISIAGGMYRVTDTALLRFQREAIASRGDLRVLDAERTGLVARQARLQAELDGNGAVVFPKEQAEDKRPTAQQVMREEQLIFQSRRTQLQAQVDSLSHMKTMLENEVQTLQSKGAALDRQIALVRKELDNISALLSKGLSYNSRQLTLDQDAARLESLKVDTSLSVLRTKQDVSKAERSILDLRNQRRNDVLVEMRQVEARLSEVAERTATALSLTYEAEMTAPRLLSDRQEDERTLPLMTIIRQAGAGNEPRTFQTGETDPVQPGDIIKIERLTLAQKKTVQLPSPVIPAEARLGID